jgi:ribosome maturation factor RimP
MITQEQLAATVEEILRGSDKFLVETVIRPGNRITVFIDGDNKVSIADCQSLNRMICEKLNREAADYELTVSSSGMDRPIRLPRQYKARIGQELEVILNDGEKTSGVLATVAEEGITLEHPVKNPRKEKPRPNTVIGLDKIKSAKIIITIGKFK